MSTAHAIIPRLSRNIISIAFSLLILAIAVFTLYEILRDVDLGKVLSAMESQPAAKIAIAGAFVIAAYVTLTFYDVFALSTIGRRHIPYPVAALASFTSSTIGHNLGAAVLTGGLVRLRIYSAWGLGVVDVAKIAVVTGMTFWLGNTFLLGGAIACAPEAASVVGHLPLWINRTMGFTGLTVIAGYLAWLAPRRRAIGGSGWRIVLPTPRLTLAQIGIGAMDLTLVTLVMVTLLPSNPAVGFLSVLVIFLTASLLGTISHAPGGLGVIEVTMLLGLRQFQKEELLASPLTFRVIYFILPLLLAALCLGLRELWMIARSEPARRRRLSRDT